MGLGACRILGDCFGGSARGLGGPKESARHAADAGTHDLFCCGKGDGTRRDAFLQDMFAPPPTCSARTGSQEFAGFTGSQGIAGFPFLKPRGKEPEMFYPNPEYELQRKQITCPR